ncbi:MAG: CRISPR-associated protein Cas4 [Chloroflexi bacterium]|nr:CRISPR-associated protein Cas4 [Chloroflexota bacterium]
MSDFNTDHYLRINEIKNYLYCGRISYYTLCLRLDRETDLSKGGVGAEQETKVRMKRRKSALHTVHQGMRHFDVSVVSHALRLIGRVDEMVETDAGVYLIDYKDTDRDYGYWRTQMAAYALAAQEMGNQVLGSYVYIIPRKRYEAIEVQPRDMRRLEQIVAELAELIVHEVCPPPAKQIGKCRSCQYANFCADVF